MRAFCNTSRASNLSGETRRNEMVSFIKQGLEGFACPGPRSTGAFPFPLTRSVVYVWIDTLTNYISAVGYLQDDETFDKWWPADVHVVGKDILRFHTIIWPCILMALDLPLPKRVCPRLDLGRVG